MAISSEHNVKVLPVLQAVAELGSLTAAAKRLLVSQPYVSHLIGDTERQLGVQLVERSKKPATLTAAGRYYCDGLARLAQDADKLSWQMAALAAHRAGSLTVGFGETSTVRAMVALITAFSQRCAGYHLDVHEQASWTVFHEMLAGNADAYLGVEPALHLPVYRHCFSRKKVALVGPRTADLPPRISELSQLRFLTDQPVITYDPSSVLDQYMRRLFEQAEVPVRAQVQLLNVNTVQQLAARGAAWALVPVDRPLALSPQAAIIPVAPELLSLPVVIACKKGQETRPELDCLISTVEDVHVGLADQSEVPSY
ncbi:LysR family transcriptional regulator [Lacticaseibacillus kribbianus]|uniref:LysR family transcriptional regulator n=1 Tax=Lacticaseibacillus kribbianus TaxID=2926292 RepID=UPI001CD4134C